jgi:hypothetical protein
MLLDLADCKIRHHFDPANLRIRVRKLVDVTFPVANSFIFANFKLLVEINHHCPDIFYAQIGHPKLTLVFSWSTIVSIVLGFYNFGVSR